jgi:hypothetical protein
MVMAVVLCDRVHGVVGRCPELVNAGYGAVTNRAAVMPSYRRAIGNRVERRWFFGRHAGFLMVSITQFKSAAMQKSKVMLFER